jgi:DNA polymerase III subunit gamma/tau
MVIMSLNLSRKWRSKHFGEVIGQKLVIRLIKNSLYRNIFFPVYLFSGMRGCGKTTLARLFAAAINCEQLAEFQKNPQHIVMPCLLCLSCKAMQEGRHPDFIEVDAASHTGVENIRALTDTALFIPSLGRKRVYLIDEAHMLSKAAFSALLKILEEPPISVVFMLATTEFYKVLDTVRSRCFHLFINPLTDQEIVLFLATLCKHEAISYEQEALFCIAQQAEGSARDALNLLERVKLVQTVITKKAVITTLGIIDDEQFFLLFESLLKHDTEKLMQLYVSFNIKQYNSQLLFKKTIELLQACINIKAGRQQSSGITESSSLYNAIMTCSLEHLIKLFELCYFYEMKLLKTSTPATMFEMLLLKMCFCTLNNHTIKVKTEALSQDKKEPILTKLLAESTSDNWTKFIEKLADRPLPASTFAQSRFLNYDQANRVVKIEFIKNSSFYKELLDANESDWKALLDQAFEAIVTLNVCSSATPSNQAPLVVSSLAYAPVKMPAKLLSESTPSSSFKVKAQHRAQPFAVADMALWPQASLLLKFFPGTISYKLANKDN